ncbi:MAG: YncE family protein [Balneolaceae bacterium]
MNSLTTKPTLASRRRGPIDWRHLIAAASLLVTTACDNGPLSENQDQNGTEAGVELYVANEGNWSDSNGSLSLIRPGSGEVLQNRFESVNGRPLAGIIQTIVPGSTEEGVPGRLFIILNNSDRIEVVDPETLESIESIPMDGEGGFTPSGFTDLDGEKGYVAGLYTNEVAVVDLESMEITGTRIAVGQNPQAMAVSGTTLFVGNNGFGADRTVSVIDTDTDEVTGTTDVGAGPIQFLPLEDGRLVVLSAGYKAYDEEWNRDPENDEEGRLDFLEGTDGSLIATIETGGFPGAMVLDPAREILYVMNSSEVQQVDLGLMELLQSPFVSRTFRGGAWSSVDERLYLAQSRGYTQSGQVIAYDIEGAALDSFPAGIAPSDILLMFNENLN